MALMLWFWQPSGMNLNRLISREFTLMRQHIIMDGRNLWDLKVVDRVGFLYYGIGRGTYNNNQ